MNFTCESEKLQKAVGLVSKAISHKKTTIPIMENLLLEITDSQLRLRGNDLEMGIENTIEVSEVQSTGSALLNATTLSSIVSKFQSGQSIHVSSKENGMVMLSSGKIKFDLLSHNIDEYPSFPKMEEGGQFTLKAETLKPLIKHTIFAVSQDETKQFLNGILLKIENGEIVFVSTDGFRLALRTEKLDAAAPDSSVIVPFKTMNEIQKILQATADDQVIEITISANQICFKSGDFLVISRLIQGQFPAYNQVLPTTVGNSFSVDCRQFVSAAERASIIAGHSNNVVKVSFENESLELRASAPKMGEFKEGVSLSRSEGSDSHTIAFNVKLLLDALKNVESDQCELSFNNALSPCVIKPVSEESYIYIIMPIRTSDFDSENSRSEEKEVATVS